MFDYIRRMFGPARAKAPRTMARPRLETLERREVPATLALPRTEVPSFTATFNMTLPFGGGSVLVSGHPVAGGNYLGTLNGAVPLRATYCVDINLDVYPTAYRNASVTADGKAYGAAVPHADAISWLLLHFGRTSVTPLQQDALQAAIWRTEYGDGFQLDGVDNDNGAPAINSRMAPLYKAELAALAGRTAPASLVSWISPGANPGAFSGRGQPLVALTDTLSPINLRMVTFLQSRLGTRLGGGECAHLATEALRVSGAAFDQPLQMRPDGDYNWGTRTASLTYVNGRAVLDGKPVGAATILFGVQPGDVIQYSASHTAVVAAVDRYGWPTAVYEQNVDGGRTRVVVKRAVNLKTYAGAWVHIYHPVERAAAPAGKYRFTVVNNTAAPVQVQLAEGASRANLATLARANTAASYLVFQAQAGAAAGAAADVLTLIVNGSIVRLRDGAGYEIVTLGGRAVIRQLPL